METTRTRAYLQVQADGATVHIPNGGKWTGGTEKVKAPRGVGPGWYRCLVEFDSAGRVWVEPGKRIADLQKEARRLRRLSEGNAMARTRSPGIAGHMHAEHMATESLRARRSVQRYFADLLEAAATLEREAPSSGAGSTDYTRRVVAVEQRRVLALKVAKRWQDAGALVAMSCLDVEVPGFGSLPLFVVCVLGKQLDPTLSAEEMAAAVADEED
jgi:hypothetical protein